uniref:hypothetical protein n=1 Tax=Ulva meridionalis TaxID=434723 RepID=UPI002114AD3D|nr:hypothetical protein NQY40_mgp02 [Ulva meridionalis]UTA96488.1 hypothetical protein [Ulva meridionalis]UTA96548.1 hypothetical protein [Ulva meridionalis]UTA96606.1 hypothetical protein [Ulva meridionalis]UTA96658.1 hypothetical protein [Ulva meridionalis]UTA96710.1 hypothetical protein [Ulva meridionalis]
MIQKKLLKNNSLFPNNGFLTTPLRRFNPLYSRLCESKGNNAPFSIPYEQYNLTPIEILNVDNNRNQLKFHGYKRAGIYVWLTPNEKIYVGRSINLYARVRSYFYRIPKYKGASLIRNYLNKHGFNGMRLILFLLPKKKNIPLTSLLMWSKPF